MALYRDIVSFFLECLNIYPTPPRNVSQYVQKAFQPSFRLFSQPLWQTVRIHVTLSVPFASQSVLCFLRKERRERR